MKRFIELLFAGVLLLSGSSCKKYLDVTSPATIDQTTAFASVSYTNSALIGCYNQLIGDNGYGNRLSCLYPQSADDFKKFSSDEHTMFQNRLTPLGVYGKHIAPNKNN